MTTEFGIRYSFNEYPVMADILDFPVGMHYQWTHEATGTSGSRYVCVRNEAEGRALIEQWNKRGSSGPKPAGFQYQVIRFYDRRRQPPAIELPAKSNGKK